MTTTRQRAHSLNSYRGGLALLGRFAANVVRFDQRAEESLDPADDEGQFARRDGWLDAVGTVIEQIHEFRDVFLIEFQKLRETRRLHMAQRESQACRARGAAIVEV